MIRVQNVSKIYPTRFGKKLVLDDISFELRKGEKLGILGRNGAGKSTLIRLLGGAEFPTSGKITTDMSVSWPLAFGGGFQDNLTGVDNIRFLSRVYDQDFQTNLAFVEEFSELGEYLREEVRTYSSGMRARLAFAISMIIEFDCFLIDEVSAVGDARFHDRCNHELFERRADRAMVIVSHNPSYISDHCDRFSILRDGKLAFYEDFDTAYSLFRSQIGLAQGKKSEKRKTARSRKQLIENTHTSAMQDETFSALVFEAHVNGNKKRWLKAERLYREALDRQPYQRSYWVQVGHAAKEAGFLQRAEAAYRTACAIGEPVAEVEPFVREVLHRQGDSLKRHPLIPYRGNQASKQPPAIPDIELFTRLCWGEDVMSDDEVLDVMRRVETCDELLAFILSDQRFAIYHSDWIAEQGSSGSLLVALPKPQESGRGIPATWARNLVSITALNDDHSVLEAMALELERQDSPWSRLRSWGGFRDWAEAERALSGLRSNQSANVANGGATGLAHSPPSKLSGDSAT